MGRHVVKQGECFASIAARYGFADEKAVTEDPQNADLRERRPESGLLCPGDEVFIPERSRKEVDAKAGEVTRLTVTVPERRVLLTVLDGADQPIADAPCVIEGGEVVATGTTDGAGGLEAVLPGTLRWARLDVGGLEWELDLGGLDPAEGTADGGRAGVAGRLSNLGYDPGEGTGESDERLRFALRGFEVDHGVERAPDDEAASIRKLKEVHGC